MFLYMYVRHISPHIWKEKLRKQHQIGNSPLQMIVAWAAKDVCYLFLYSYLK